MNLSIRLYINLLWLLLLTGCGTFALDSEVVRPEETVFPTSTFVAVSALTETPVSLIATEDELAQSEGVAAVTVTRMQDDAANTPTNRQEGEPAPVVITPSDFSKATMTAVPTTMPTMTPIPTQLPVPSPAATATPTQLPPASPDQDAFCATVTEIPQIECEALVALYTHLAGEEWQHGVNWLQTNTPCSWNIKMISCEGQHVTGLSFYGEGLRGDMPPEVGNLSHLRFLNLIGNNVSSVPPEIGNLTNLTYLDLGGNNLSSVPLEIGTLTNLSYLSLDSNLSNFPSELGNLTNLTSLHLSGDGLSSPPPELWNLKNLTELTLSDLNMSNVPPEIGNLTNLEYLNLENNNLINLPPEIGNLTELTDLRLSGNRLSSVPPEIGNLTNLTFLDLRDNELSSLPSEICAALPKGIILNPPSLCSP